MKHKGKRLFISGIPTSGKSYLAKKLANHTGGIAVSLDDFREGLAKEEKYRKWTNFYLDKNEEEYLTKTSPEEQWQNLVAQSEGLWPAFLDEMNKFVFEERPVIFECVNILPHLANKNLSFQGLILIGKSLEEVLERNIVDPRWGDTLELQKLEAKIFFEIERPRYTSEAEKYSYPVFESADEAFDAALKSLV
jgi:adenylate kinase family enzyme